MLSRRNIILGIVGIVLIAVAVLGYGLFQELQKAASEDPLVWEEDIAAFEAQDRASPPPQDAIVFTGSSSIRFWDSLREDMAPIPVIRRGFGGAKLNDVLHYADRLVSAYNPRAVVVFAGSNDITPNSLKSPAQLLETYQAFVEKVREADSDLPIYYIAITPSLLRWSVWPDAQATNAAIKAYTDQVAGLHFIETSQALLGENGEPDPDNYLMDRLHLSEQGYAKWTEIVRGRLVADFPEYERAASKQP